MKNLIGKTGMALLAGLILGGCSDLNEDRVNGNAQLQVRLTDAPGNYDAVYIEIEDVLIHRAGDDSVGEEGWERIEGVRRGTYNLLELVNGHDTLLVDANVPSGHLGHLRLVLGDDNRVVIAGTEYELKTPSAQQSGIKIKINQDLRENDIYEILLDFDAARSIVEAGNSGQYLLKPVIRVVPPDPTGGTVRGVVTPGNITTAVLAVAGTDTLGTYTDTLGNFMLKAVPAGNYAMRFIPDTASGYAPFDTTGITVGAGEVHQVNVTLLENAED